MFLEEIMTIQAQTQFLQEIIYRCPIGGTVAIPAGTYTIGALFLKSDMTLMIPAGVTLLGSENLADYPLIDTRVAGINMKWPAALINLIDCDDVSIQGGGLLDGQGAVWWHKFWGADGKSGMMADYEARGLRWNVDYDCQRPRNILIQNCQRVTMTDVQSVNSGFWNTQVVYSTDVTLQHLTIKNGPGPSTDGIDIDSSERVVVDGCYVACNDDNICIKSGRGLEAAQLARTTRHITIKNCQLGAGSGITIGSEVSGGIENIEIYDNQFNGTSIGFRLKSSKNRGGFIRHIHVHDLTMQDVTYPFHFELNWFPAYSYSGDVAEIETMPMHWQKIIAGVEGDAGLTAVSDLIIENIQADFTTIPLSCAFYVQGNSERPLEQLHFKNLQLTATEFGKINGVATINLENVAVTIKNETREQDFIFER